MAFPPYGVWPLAPVGVALLAAAAHRRRLRAGAGLGFLTGVAFFAPLLAWTNLHTGCLPWVLLSLLQAGYLALLGAATAWVSPLVDRGRWAWPALTGLLWVGQEALRDRTPFGGFPWGRLAFSQDDVAAAAAGRAGRRAAGDVRGGARRRAARRRWRWSAPAPAGHAGAPGATAGWRPPVRRRWPPAVASRSRWSPGLLVPVAAAGSAPPSRWRSCRATCRGWAWTSTPNGRRC